MKTVFKLFAYEFKNIYKQALIFAFISTFLFALSISVMCFSSDMVQGYKDYLDDYGYSTLWVREVEDIGRYEEVDKLCDYLSVRASGITIWHPFITDGSVPEDGDTADILSGQSYVFRDTLPIDFDYYYFEGGGWTSADNQRRAEGLYPIFISKEVAENLQVNVGDTVSFYYELTDGLHEEKMRVADIFCLKDEEEGYYRDDFAIPFSFILENKDNLTEKCTFFLEMNKASDTFDLYPKVKSLRIGDVSDDELELVNVMRYVLIAVAVAIVAVTFVVLSNSLTITVNSRKKFMARLKLLGATTDKITAAYFILLVASFILSFALSILLSYLLCGYFTAIAVAALEYKVSMNLHWGAVGILFAVGGALLAVRYLLFRLKVKKVSPAEFIKEE